MRRTGQEASATLALRDAAGALLVPRSGEKAHPDAEPGRGAAGGVPPGVHASRRARAARCGSLAAARGPSPWTFLSRFATCRSLPTLSLSHRFRRRSISQSELAFGCDAGASFPASGILLGATCSCRPAPLLLQTGASTYCRSKEYIVRNRGRLRLRLRTIKESLAPALSQTRRRAGHVRRYGGFAALITEVDPEELWPMFTPPPPNPQGEHGPGATDRPPGPLNSPPSPRPEVQPEEGHAAERALEFLCPTCGDSLQVDPGTHGTIFDCPNCGNPVRVPDADELQEQEDRRQQQSAVSHGEAAAHTVAGFTGDPRADAGAELRVLSGARQRPARAGSGRARLRAGQGRQGRG